MLTVYGKMMPLRVLEEIRVWKMQEKERTLAIRNLMPTLAPEYVRLLEQWEDVFDNTEAEASQLIRVILDQGKETRSDQLDNIIALANASIEQSREFIHHLHLLMERNPWIAMDPVAETALRQHGSEYFLGVLETMLRSGHLAELYEDTEVAPDNRHHLSRADRAEMAAERPVPIGGHRLPPLPYPYDALEPYIDERTMRLHHQKHHASYVDGLNKAEKMMQMARDTNDFELLKHWEREAAFNGAGHYLHTIFWNVMSPDGGGKPSGAIARQIDRDFGSFERFKRHFSAAAEKVEGGGWALLVWSPRSHRLEILQAEKHQNLSQWDVVPLLVLDVWEHAYYLKYQNERRKYIDAWWNTVNWNHVDERFQAARQLRWTPY